MKAIILAAGLGRRLHPITETIPKPMLPINGRPIIETILNSLHEASVNEIMIMTGHHANKLQNFIDTINRFDLKISYLNQGEPLGTGHAVQKAKEFIDDTVLVLAADTAFSVEHITGIQALHKEKKADVSLCLKRLSPEQISKTSSVKLTDSGNITDFVEKPKLGNAPSNLAAALLHIYEPEMVNYLDKISLSTRGEYELTEATKMMIDDSKVVVGKEFPPPADLTDVCDFLRLNFSYMKGFV